MGWIIRGSNPGGGGCFRAVHTGPEDYPASRVVSTVPFLGLKRQKPGADHPPSSARLRMGWIYTSTCPLCLPACNL